MIDIKQQRIALLQQYYIIGSANELFFFDNRCRKQDETIIKAQEPECFLTTSRDDSDDES